MYNPENPAPTTSASKSVPGPAVFPEVFCCSLDMPFSPLILLVGYYYLRGCYIQSGTWAAAGRPLRAPCRLRIEDGRGQRSTDDCGGDCETSAAHANQSSKDKPTVAVNSSILASGRDTRHF